MYLICVYDINRKRVQKVMKICRKFLIHIQNSVFEGELSEVKFRKLISSLTKLIDNKEDSIIFYRFHHKKVFSKKELGYRINKTDNVV